MITVKIHGGLGNQMFQYATARALSLRSKQKMRIDPAPLFDITPRKNFQIREYRINNEFRLDPPMNIRARWAVHIKLPFFDTAFNKFYPMLLGNVGYWKYVKEKTALFDSRINQLNGNVYLDGYWQSENYFKDFEDVIRSEFTFRHPISPVAQELERDIKASTSVCVHVRRGDYVNIAITKSIHDVVRDDYYEKAIKILKEKLGERIKVFVFSDDIGWCKKNLNFATGMTFVDEKYGDVAVRDDLQLMSFCKHFIIPNSSFSWWAAWLSRHVNKMVIAPKKWFNNNADTSTIIPQGWLRI